MTEMFRVKGLEFRIPYTLRVIAFWSRSLVHLLSTQVFSRMPKAPNPQEAQPRILSGTTQRRKDSFYCQCARAPNVGLQESF